MKRKKIQKKSDEVKLVLGVCWYTPEEFIKMKQTAIDGDNFEDTYEEWRQFAEKTMTDLKKKGLILEKFTSRQMISDCGVRKMTCLLMVPLAQDM